MKNDHFSFKQYRNTLDDDEFWRTLHTQWQQYHCECEDELQVATSVRDLKDYFLGSAVVSKCDCCAHRRFARAAVPHGSLDAYEDCFAKFVDTLNASEGSEFSQTSLFVAAAAAHVASGNGDNAATANAASDTTATDGVTAAEVTSDSQRVKKPCNDPHYIDTHALYISSSARQSKHSHVSIVAGGIVVRARGCGFVHRLRCTLRALCASHRHSADSCKHCGARLSLEGAIAARCVAACVQRCELHERARAAAAAARALLGAGSSAPSNARKNACCSKKPKQSKQSTLKKSALSSKQKKGRKTNSTRSESGGGGGGGARSSLVATCTPRAQKLPMLNVHYDSSFSDSADSNSTPEQVLSSRSNEESDSNSSHHTATTAMSNNSSSSLSTQTTSTTMRTLSSSSSIIGECISCDHESTDACIHHSSPWTFKDLGAETRVHWHCADSACDGHVSWRDRCFVVEEDILAVDFARFCCTDDDCFFDTPPI